MASSELKAKLEELPPELIIRAIDKGKEIADKAFRQREWKVAVETYTEAIAGAQYIKERVNLLPILFRNRSSAFFAMKHFEQSLNDAKASLQLEPGNAKSNYRAGRALFSMSKFEEAFCCFTQALTAATDNGSEFKQLQDIDKWKVKAEKAKAEEIAKEKALKSARRYDIDYSRFEDLSDDEGNDHQTSNIKEGLMIEDYRGQGHISNQVPAFQRSRAEKLLRQLVEGRSELDPEIISSFKGTVSLLSNMSVLQLPQRRARQLLQPSPLSIWFSAIEDLHSRIALYNGATPIQWLVAGFGVGATLHKAVTVSKDVTFVGIDTMQPSLARAFHETMRLNCIAVASDSNPISNSPQKNSSSPQLPGLASLRKPAALINKGQNSPTVPGTLPAKKSTKHIQGCLESLTHKNLGDAAQSFGVLILDPELFDDGLLGRRLLPSIRNAHANFLSPGAQVIPRSGKLRAVIVEIKIVPDPTDISGIDLAAFGDRCGWACSEESLSLASSSSTRSNSRQQGIPWKQLSKPFDLWNFQFDDRKLMEDLPKYDEVDVSARLTAEGRANAILTWFDLDLGDTFTVSNHPSSALKLWKNAVHWISPVCTTPHTSCRVRVSRSDTVTRFEIQENIETERIGKAMLRTWEILGSNSIIPACRDAINHSIRFMKGLRREPKYDGVHTLELQSGPTCALMSMLALKAGAKHSLACDMNSQYCHSNAELAKLNGLLTSSEKAGGLNFTQVHPSKLTCGNAHAELARPADVLMLPIPEQGLFEGGLVKMIRTVQQNPDLLSSDALVFPAKISIWAEVIETTHIVRVSNDNMDCSALFKLVNSSASATSAVDLRSFQHRPLSAPARMATVDLAEVVHGKSTGSIISQFSNKLDKIKITSEGRANAVVWWWSIDLCSHTVKDSLTLTNAPNSTTPWQQELQFIPESLMLRKDEEVSVSVSLTQNELGLHFALSAATLRGADQSCQLAQIFDPYWAKAWAKVRNQQKQINDAVVQSAKLFGQVVDVAEAIAQDPASIPPLIEGVLIDVQDAHELASSYRTGLS